MDICGKWKVKEMRFPTLEEEAFTPDNLPSEEEFYDIAQMMKCITEFAGDGVLNTLLFVPEEMREQAETQGAVVRDDGYAVIESTQWKEENGKFYYDTKVEGEVLGEKVDPFAEITVTPEGYLIYGYGTILLERA